MKVIYCSPVIDTEDLKRQPSTYTSSKIGMRHETKKPYYIKEFRALKNIKYLELEPSPALAKLWDDMMSKRTFSYNFEHLNSRSLFEEYEKYNQDVAKRINQECEKEDLVIINDSSLYLLPSLISCRVAVRNIRFDESFIESVPYYKEILLSLFKSEKFFETRKSLEAFNSYVGSVYEFKDLSLGGTWYMKPPVDKDRVEWVLQACYSEAEGDSVLKVYGCGDGSCKCLFPKEQLRQLRTKVKRFVKERYYDNSYTILTNAPLLYLEEYIRYAVKRNEKLSVRYLRNCIEVDKEQELMIQYLRKTYNCNIETVDIYDFDIIILEMLHCDVFVGKRYYELAKILRRPIVHERYDPTRLREYIEDCIGELEERKEVHSEDEYIKAFMEINGCGIQPENLSSNEDSIDTLVVDYTSKRNEELHKKFSVSKTEIKIDNDPADKCDACNCNEHELYKKIVKGKKVLFKKVGEGGGGSKCEGCMKKCIDGSDSNKEYCSDETNCYCNSPKISTTKLKECNCKGLIHQRKSKEIEKTPTNPPLADIKKIKDAWESSNKVILLDYDGTLREIMDNPLDARPTEEVLDLLKKLSEQGRVVICTGRSTSIVDDWFPPEVEVYAEHGAEHRMDGKWKVSHPLQGLNDCIEVMEFFQMRTPGSVIERKKTGASFHYRKSGNFDVAHLYSLLKRMVGDNVSLGKCIIEVRSGRKDIACRDVRPFICIGDDVTDEDMFKASDGISIKVGSGPTFADYHVKNVPEMLSLLRTLVE